MPNYGAPATITSQREQDLITSLVESNNAWLGGSDDNLDGSWAWITGEPWTYENMGPGQPDNTDGNSTKLNLWYRYPGKWADNRNANLQSYVLERIIRGDPSRAEAESPCCQAISGSTGGKPILFPLPSSSTTGWM